LQFIINDYVGDSELSQLAEELTAGIGNLLATIQELSSLPTEVRSAIDTFIRRINLEHVPDVLCNFLDGSSEERIALLNALELKPRMQLILAILNGKLADREALKRQLLARLAPLDRLKRLMPSLAKQRTSGFFGGDSVSSSGEGMDEIFDRVRQAKLPESVRKMADRDLKRLEKISPAQAEYSVIRTYLEWIVDLPWQTSSDEVIDLAATRQQLDKGTEDN
jgi:ATP-dependent Lon protease